MGGHPWVGRTPKGGGGRVTHRGEGLDDVAVVDVAGVGEDGGAGEPRERFALSSQQHDVTRRHFGEVGEAASDAWGGAKRGFERRPPAPGKGPGVFSGGLTHDLGGGGGADDDGEVGGDEGHAGFDVLVDAVLGLVQLQRHVTRLLDPLQLLLRQLLPGGGGDYRGGGNRGDPPILPPAPPNLPLSRANEPEGDQHPPTAPQGVTSTPQLHPKG